MGRAGKNKAGPVRVELRVEAVLGWPSVCPGKSSILVKRLTQRGSVPKIKKS